MFRLAVAASLTLAPLAPATIITLDAIDSGYYRSIENGSFNNGAFITGVTRNAFGVITESRGWLGFDLSSVTDTIISARLELESSDRNGSGQTITFRDALTPYADLGSVISLDIFNDLGSGTLFGSGIHTGGTINTFTLNTSAISSLNAASSFWAVGLRNPTINNVAFASGGGANSGDHLKLILTTESGSVPEAGATLSLLGISLLSLAALRSRLDRR
jgi:hypothetical protein